MPNSDLDSNQKIPALRLMDRGQLSSGKKEKKDIIVFAMDTALVSS